MISTTRVIEELENLIAAEKKKLTAYAELHPGLEIPREEKTTIRILIPAVQKLRRQLDYAEALGPYWLQKRPSLHRSAASLNRSATWEEN